MPLSAQKNLSTFYIDHDIHSYVERSSAKGVTDAGIMRLVAACPNLQDINLPGANGRWLTDAALIFLLEHCPKLSWFNFMSTKSDGSVFDALRHRADLAPKLGVLYLVNMAGIDAQGRKAMESVRELSRVRPRPQIILFEKRKKKEKGTGQVGDSLHAPRIINGKKGFDYSAWDD
jgi:hypothetical protein